MKNLFIFLLILPLFLNNCSFDNKTGVWKEHNKKIIESVKKEENVETILLKNKIFDKEIENSSSIVISEQIKNTNWLEDNLTQNNNVPHLFYENKKNIIFKSKKIGKNKHTAKDINFEPLFFQEKIIFCDLSGNIYSFSTTSKKLL